MSEETTEEIDVDELREFLRTGECPNAGDPDAHPCPYCDDEVFSQAAGRSGKEALRGYMTLRPHEGTVDSDWLLNVLYGNHEAMLDALAEWRDEDRLGSDLQMRLAELIGAAQEEIAVELYERGHEAYESWVDDDDEGAD